VRSCIADNEDEQGAGYLLFPLAGQLVTNPLAAGVSHRLPGPQDGERLSWQVTSAGGREHFIIFANSSPLSSFERMSPRSRGRRATRPSQAVSLAR
jgi:hypothetical protein